MKQNCKVHGEIPCKCLVETPTGAASELSDLLCAGHAIVKDGVIFNIDERLWRSEEFEACMTAMDDAGVPRFDENEAVYSLWGRSCWMARNLAGT